MITPQKEAEAELNQAVLNSESAALNIGGGLGTIQDENDSNQDSDFSGDEEDKPVPTKEAKENNAENSD